MKGGDSSLWRGWWKTAVLFVSLGRCLMAFLLIRLRRRPSIEQRSLWLHRSCQVVLQQLGFRVHARGCPPVSGLLVSNHLSYLDILFFGAYLPCVFVAKSEVRRWPVLGLLAWLGGTVFIDRRRPKSAANAAKQIEALLRRNLTVLVFPEGTSSDGSAVLRFCSPLLEPAIRAASPITPAAIGYRTSGKDGEKELCYYGELQFVPHLVRTLSRTEVCASLSFGRAEAKYRNRKEAAVELRSRVAGLRATGLA